MAIKRWANLAHIQEEEVYQFRSNPRDVGAVVIMTVDEASYTSTWKYKTALIADDGTSTGSYPDQGDPHPIGKIWPTTSRASVLNDSLVH